MHQAMLHQRCLQESNSKSAGHNSFEAKQASSANYCFSNQFRSRQSVAAYYSYNFYSLLALWFGRQLSSLFILKKKGENKFYMFA